MSSRRKSRELALQLLFQSDLTHSGPDEILETSLKERPNRSRNREFAEFLFRKSLENRSRIDDLIRRHSRNWRLERMSAVDRNVLRVAVTEFLYTQTPRVVVIDEAIEIARRYSTGDSTEFVNGVLDAIREELVSERGEGE
jgi:transcription antitermination protein NusB